MTGKCACFIVPPGVFEHVMRTGSAEDRDAAIRTLDIDHTIRSTRLAQQATLAALSVPRAPARAGPGAGRPQRTIFDAHHLQDLHASKVLRAEGQAPVADQSADQGYDGLGATYKFYWEVLQRDSIDARGLPLLGEVHFGRGYDNAFWDGERMMFGDGDGRLFTGFTSAVDVIGHELTHGVTGDTIALLYQGQSGALNESISDVFGSLIKQHQLGQTVDQADWLIGAGILGPALPGAALRSMKAPGTAYSGDSQPADMANYVSTMSDNGGVHTNSGIPNHAFYLAATAIGGHAWEQAGRIWYDVLQSRGVQPAAQFAAFATATVQSASRLYGAGSAQARAVSAAWAQVGVAA